MIAHNIIVQKKTNNLTERNKHRKGLPDLVTTFLDTRHHKPSLDFIARFSMITLGRSKENKDWQVLTILIGLSLVLKSFMKNLFITKSSEFRSFLFNWQTSKQYNRIGKHLLLINCKIVSSDATRPTFPKIALAAR